METEPEGEIVALFKRGPESIIYITKVIIGGEDWYYLFQLFPTFCTKIGHTWDLSRAIGIAKNTFLGIETSIDELLNSKLYRDKNGQIYREFSTENNENDDESLLAKEVCKDSKLSLNATKFIKLLHRAQKNEKLS